VSRVFALLRRLARHRCGIGMGGGTGTGVSYSKARSFFEHVLAVAPGDSATQCELGMVAEGQGQFKDALQPDGAVSLPSNQSQFRSRRPSLGPRGRDS
jgi:hypothetical protein